MKKKLVLTMTLSMMLAMLLIGCGETQGTATDSGSDSSQGLEIYNASPDSLTSTELGN